MKEIVKAFSNSWKAFVNVLKQIGQSNRMLVIFTLGSIFSLIYLAAVSENKTVWVLSVLISILCLISYGKTKNLTEASLTLAIGLFTIFTVQWTTEYTLIFIISIFILIVFSFIISSIKAYSTLESIITIAAGYLQNGKNHKEKFSMLYSIAKRPTRTHQLGIEERCIVVKELVFLKVPTEEMYNCMEVIEGFKTVLGFDLVDAISHFSLLFNAYIIQRNKIFNMNDMEKIFEVIVASPFNPKDFFDILDNLKGDLLSSKLSVDALLLKIKVESITNRNKELVIENIKHAVK